MATPGWLDDALADEWVDEPPPDEYYPAARGSVRGGNSINGTTRTASGSSAGTVVVREDQPVQPILARTPGPAAGPARHAPMKDFFSPLPLQSMFEPPTPASAYGTPPGTLPRPRPRSLVAVDEETEPETEPEPEPEPGHAPDYDEYHNDYNEYEYDDGEHFEGELVGSETEVDEAYSQHDRGGRYLDEWEPTEEDFYQPNPDASRLALERTRDDRHHGDDDEENDVDGPATDEILETDVPNLAGFNGRKPSRAFQFTFNMPRASDSEHGQEAKSNPRPDSHSTPTPLRLFQFQYDTYTADQLLQMANEVTTPHVRSTKRIRLSPEQEVPAQRKPRDYVRESRSLMAQIKGARSFTMTANDTPISNAKTPPAKEEEEQGSWIDYAAFEEQVKSAERERERQQQLQRSPSARFLVRHREDIDEPDMDQLAAEANLEHRPAMSADGGGSGKRSTYSSIARRTQAADFMARIKSDMHRGRLLSTATVLSEVNGTNDSTDKPQQLSRPLTEEKENEAEPAQARLRPRPSPRKLLRRLSAADEVDRELEAQDLTIPQVQAQPVPAFVLPAVVVQHFSPSPTKPFLAPASSTPDSTGAAMLHPTGSARNLDDLNRFVSSSTATSSAGSCVKHAGLPSMTRIAPTDLPTLPERVGAMVFDRAANRWVRAEIVRGDAEHSEDPFRDIESLHSSSAHADDEARFEGGSVTGFSDDLDDDAEFAPVQVMTGVLESDADTTLDWDIAEAVTHPATETLNLRRHTPFDARSPMPPRAIPQNPAPGPFSFPRAQALAPSVPSPRRARLAPVSLPMRVQSPMFPDRNASPARRPMPAQLQQPPRVPSPTTTLPVTRPVASVPARIPSPERIPSPMPPRELSPAVASPLRVPIVPPAVAPTPVRNTPVVVPRSALKSTPAAGTQTPVPGSSARPTHRRSVSFSDGRMEGKIRGLRSDDSSSEEERPTMEGTMSLQSKRILGKFAALEDTDMGSEIETPSKASTGSREPLRRTTSRRPSFAGNATFLTECSFGVAHDRLVTVITDVQPYEPYWEEIVEIDLSNKNIESLARLKEFLPKVERLKIDSNRVEWLTGVPKTLRSLSAVKNILTSLTSFNHLLKLERLDLSYNKLDSLHQLSCLTYLRELSVDGNNVVSISGLETLSALERVSLRGNKLRDVDLIEVVWPKIESLDLSQNTIRIIRNMQVLGQSLCLLNIDGNKLTSLGEGAQTIAMPKLRVLRCSDNSIHKLDVSGMPVLKTLYADGNKMRDGIGDVSGLSGLRRLENLSLRNQATGPRNERVLPSKDIRDIKRLYLSANPLPVEFLQEACYNMVYLELAACRLEELPADLARFAPNLRVLNLNYNFLNDVTPLTGLTRLKRLTVIGSRIKSVKAVIRVLRGMPDIEMVDFRMNPFSLGWYLPLLVRDVPGALQPSENGESDRRGTTWEELDRKFRSDLPDGSYVGRLAYRGLVMNACPQVAEIDGVVVRSDERSKAAALLKGMQENKEKRETR